MVSLLLPERIKLTFDDHTSRAGIKRITGSHAYWHGLSDYIGRGFPSTMDDGPPVIASIMSMGIHILQAVTCLMLVHLVGRLRLRWLRDNFNSGPSADTTKCHATVYTNEY